MAKRTDGIADRPITKFLPGEKNRDDDLIVRSVNKLNHLFVTGGLSTALEIGKYVLEHFFSGDPAAFHGKSRDHASFRGLVTRADLQLSTSFLYKCVAVYEQFALLPAEARAGLSFSHQVALLPVKDVEIKRALALEALRRQLIVVELQQEVREYTRPQVGETRTGRPPLHPLVRSTRKLSRLLDGTAPDDLEEALLDALTYEDAVTVRASLETSIQQLVALTRVSASSSR